MPKCPTCGRTVPTIFEHVDVSCNNWPDRGERLPLEYRGYIVDFAPFGFEYVHKDYDEGDPRYGHDASLEDCYREIDEREDNA